MKYLTEQERILHEENLSLKDKLSEFKDWINNREIKCSLIANYAANPIKEKFNEIFPEI